MNYVISRTKQDCIKKLSGNYWLLRGSAPSRLRVIVVGQVWVAEQRAGGVGAVVVHAPPGGQPRTLAEGAPIACMGASPDGALVWLGHTDGSASVHCSKDGAAICPVVQTFSCPVT